MPHGASSEAEDPRRHVAVEPGRVDERRAHVGAGHVVAGGREEEGLAAVEERLDEVAVHEHAQLNGGPVQRVAVRAAPSSGGTVAKPVRLPAVAWAKS